MVVSQHGLGGVALHRQPGDLGAGHGRLVHGALGDLLQLDGAVAVVQKQNIDLLGHRAVKLRDEVGCHLFQILKCPGRAGAVLAVVAVGGVHGGEQPGHRRPRAFHGKDVGLTGLQHLAQTAEAVDEAVGQRICVFAGNGQIQDVLQHFVLGKAGKAALLGEPLAHPLAVVRVKALLLRHPASSFPAVLRFTPYLIYYILFAGNFKERGQAI